MSFESNSSLDVSDCIDSALVDGEVRHAYYGAKELRIIDLKTLLALYVEIAFQKSPAAIRRAVTSGIIKWLSYSPINGKQSVWIARHRIGVEAPSNCHDLLIRIYSLWNLVGLNVADLKFECVAYEQNVKADVN